MSFRITVEEIDAATVDQFRLEVVEAVSDAEDGQVVLDLSGVGYLGSNGISALGAAMNEHPDLEFRLVGVAPNVRRVLEITGFSGLLTVDD